MLLVKIRLLFCHPNFSIFTSYGECECIPPRWRRVRSDVVCYDWFSCFCSLSFSLGVSEASELGIWLYLWWRFSIVNHILTRKLMLGPGTVMVLYLSEPVMENYWVWNIEGWKQLRSGYCLPWCHQSWNIFKLLCICCSDIVVLWVVIQLLLDFGNVQHCVRFFFSLAIRIYLQATIKQVKFRYISFPFFLSRHHLLVVSPGCFSASLFIFAT